MRIGRYLSVFAFLPFLISLAGPYCCNSWASDADDILGNSTCVECHEGQAETYKRSLHGRALGAKKEMKDRYGCEFCHGPGAKHAEDESAESIVSFERKRGTQAEVKNAACLKCHSASDEVALWAMGQHEQFDVSCSDCHSVHADSKPHANPSDRCLVCHKDIRSEIRRLSHHPIKENKVSCNDCHNSHGAMARAMVRDDSINELCYKCHAEKRGPFLWEHVPVEENCANCHNPHGSNRPGLLKARVSTLCQDCHNGVSHSSLPYDQTSAFGSTRSDPASRLLVGRSCLNCHTSIHGSMHSDNAFFLESSGRFLNR